VFDSLRAPSERSSPVEAAAKEPPSRRKGDALEPGLRAEGERRFGFSFAHVRVDSDAASGEEARQLGARAYTLGERIALAPPKPAVGSPERRNLILHELAHVAQGYEGRVPPATDAPIRVSEPNEPLEREAVARLAAPPAPVVKPAPPSPRARAVALRQDAGTRIPDAGPPPPTPTPARPAQTPPASAPPTAAPPAAAPPAPTPAAPAAQRPVTQTLYDGAVALIQSRNAALYNLLRAGRVGAAVSLPRASLTLTPPPGTTAPPGAQTGVDVDSTLEIIQGGVAAGALAMFENLPPSFSGTQTRPIVTQRLPIHIQAPPATQVNPELALSEQLYHEGIHALLQRDRILDQLTMTSQASPFLAQRAVYGRTARAATQWPSLRSSVATLIGARRASGSQGTPAQAADEALDEVLDERFALDRQRVVYPGALLDNALIARVYLAQALVNQLVPGPASSLETDTAVVPLIRQMTDVLNAIPFPTTATGASVGRPPPAPPPQPPPAPAPRRDAGP
jgi:hypothetical protein